MAGASVAKLDTNRWESVADLARWLLTHADEYVEAIVIVRQREIDHPDDSEPPIQTYSCPKMPIGRALGMLELAKIIYAEHACGRNLVEETEGNAS
jgi:hypothetical protein